MRDTWIAAINLRNAIKLTCAHCEGYGIVEATRWNKFPQKVCGCLIGQMIAPGITPGTEVRMGGRWDVVEVGEVTRGDEEIRNPVRPQWLRNITGNGMPPQMASGVSDVDFSPRENRWDKERREKEERLKMWRNEYIGALSEARQAKDGMIRNEDIIPALDHINAFIHFVVNGVIE